MRPMPRRTSLAAAALLATCVHSPRATAESPSPPHSLGGFPVCEASAVVAIPCGSSTCWLVGDNEVRDALFLYPMRADGSPDPAGRRRVAIDALLAPRKEISDIEALARRADGEVLTYASHSRNKRCERKKKRRAYLGLRLPASMSAEAALPGPTGFVSRNLKEGWTGVFPANPSGTLGALRRSVLEAEQVAAAGDCSATLDVEGAVAIPGPGADQVWLGLRAPLLDANAVIVRHDLAAGQLHWVDARRVDTGGAGIRGLAWAEGPDAGWVYGLSPSARGGVETGFGVWRFPAGRLTGRAADPIETRHVAQVASRSEGIAIWQSEKGPVALVVQDGDEGPSSGRCAVEATYQLVPLDGR